MGSASSTGTYGKLGEIKKEGRIIKDRASCKIVYISNA
jgi:hypothetical protein